MKGGILIFSMIISMMLVIQETKAQDALFVQGGYDWLDGIVTVGVQKNYIRLSAGVFPTKYPASKTPVTGFCWTATLDGAKWDESGYYVSIGQNSVGHRQEVRYGGGDWIKSSKPMWIAMIGYRLTVDNVYFKMGGGYGWSSGGGNGAWTYGLGLGYSFKL
jgi:hypothetical protein